MPRGLLKQRVDTRLAWLGLTHKDFASAIGMDKSSLSRALRADRPRRATLDRISKGLGVSVDALMNQEDTEVLTSSHPAFSNGEVDLDQLVAWCSEEQG
jgi:transcriptional regulator with XRE-family HTH domain